MFASSGDLAGDIDYRTNRLLRYPRTCPPQMWLDDPGGAWALPPEGCMFYSRALFTALFPCNEWIGFC
jgi:hypothetical protein